MVKSNAQKIIRQTISFCPRCYAKVKAYVVEEEERIFLEKQCPYHGCFKLLLSDHPAYYKKLHDIYFTLFKKSQKQRDYLLNVTSRCNLKCPICLANSNNRVLKDYPLESLKKFLKDKKGYKIGLMGAEPTLREDLPEIIRAIKISGNIPELHTNGIKIADIEYLKQLKNAGLREVHLQFDGFDDEIYLKIRGTRLLDIKFRALENIKKLGLSVDLKVTIVKGVNEDQMGKILEFASHNEFIKEVFYIGCRALGRAKEIKNDFFYMPDELMDILIAQCPDLLSRQDFLNFETVYFFLLWLFASRKCFYNQHYLLVRREGKLKPIAEFIDLESWRRKIENFIGKQKLNKAVGIIKIFPELIKLKQVIYFLKLFNLSSLLYRGFDISRIPSDFLLLGFISACDSFSYDEDIAKNCGKGAISLELGIQEMGALDNVLREKFDYESTGAI